MLTASPITNQPVGKTFTIAISILGVGAVMQLFLIGWAFVTRARNGIPPTVAVSSVPAPVAIVHQPAPPAGPDALDVKTDSFTSEPPQTQTTASSSTGAPKPTPVTNRPPPTEPANRFDELVFQGKQLRERGDTSTAITKFREAGAIDAKNPLPLYELALTYEKMGLTDKAGENWRKIYDMHDASSVYFAAAEAKLKVSQALAIRDIHLSNRTESEPDLSAPVAGIAAGCTLGLLQVTTEDQRDDNSAKKFVLHIPIKARSKTHVEVKDLVIHVLFYDIVDGQNVVQTSANVNSRWATPPADWADSDTEELAVEYQLPKPEPRAARRENRKYFGYIVRIYYKQQLQAATAEPQRLATQYPPPPTLPKENEK